MTKKRFDQAILKIFEGREGIEMLQVIPEGMLKDGYEIGLGKGKIEGKIEDIVFFLEEKFGDVPDSVSLRP